VGASLSLALAEQPIKILLLDAKPLLLTANPQHDIRTVALSHSSRAILKSLNVWQHLSEFSTPIKQIHVSNKGHFGFTRLHADDHGVDIMGAVVPMQRIQIAINKSLSDQANLTILSSATVKNYDALSKQILIETENQELMFTADLIIAADGAQSKMRELLNFEVITKNYQQDAIVATIDFTKKNSDYVAYERFVDDHLLALLPTSQQSSSLIFTTENRKTNQLMALSDAEFLNVLQSEFGYRLGRLYGITQRFSFPLQLIYSEQQYQENVLLLGNAAHTLHPIAGQGFNLGLRDTACLAQVLADAIKQQQPINDCELLQRYVNWRAKDQERCIRFTHNTVNLFSQPWSALSVARNLGLIAIDILPGFKRRFANRAMGYYGRAAKLTTGNPIS